jgi:hypothetical protein
MLGVCSSQDVEVVATSNGTRIVRRARVDDGVELYSWANLTAWSRSWRWIFYLPFALLNAAGVALSGADRLSRAEENICVAVGWGATVSYVFWTGEVLIDLVGWQWRHRLQQLGVVKGWELFHFHWLEFAVRWLMPSLCWVSFLSLFALLFWYRWREGAKHSPPTGPAPATTQKSRRLASPQFHAVLAAAAIAAVAVLNAARSDRASLRVGDLVVGAGIAEGAAAALLWALWGLRRNRQRPVGAAVATLGVVAANAAFAGVVVLSVHYLSGFPSFPKGATVPPLHGGPELGLSATLVWTVLGAVLLAGLAALTIWLRGKGDSSDIDEAVPDITADQVAGLSPDFAARVVQARRGARLSHSAIVPGCTLVLAFVVGGVAYTAYLAIRGLSPWSSHFDGRPGSWVAALGGLLLAALPAALARLLNPLSSAGQQVQFVGYMWDGLLLFPTEYHPLAVPPYTDQTTSDIVKRLNHDLEGDGHVVLSAHSEGTALCYLALRKLQQQNSESLARVAFVTYGSPLNGLYGLCFPRRFSGFATLAGSLKCWVNFWRRTDPIGAPVFAGKPYTGRTQERARDWPVDVPSDDNHIDVLLADPPKPQPDGYVDPASPAAPLERDRQPYVDLSVHSYYLCEPLVKLLVQDLKRESPGTAEAPRVR